jgi:UDP-GlcNAc:undecaprenyl-phosphate/decaprenyl-phosphate GlcNAc-1-phosphate transferase
MIEQSIITAAIAAASVAAVTPAVKRIAAAASAVAEPKKDRWHTRPVPLLGGVAIAAGMIVALAASGRPPRSIIPADVVIAGMFLLGLVDDLVKLKPVSKLVGQIVVACAFPLFGGSPGWTDFGILNGALEIAWIVTITNAVNLLDNMDGLCAGIAAIASAGCWFEFAGASPALATLSAAVFGATVGFLFFNFRPASIFMGDAGSLLLGSALAVLALSGSRHLGTGLISALAVPVCLLLIPLFDTAFVTLSRILSTRSASQGGRDHTSHRLVAMGFSETQAVLFLWALAAAGGSVALISHSIGAFGTALIAPLLIVALTLLGIWLARVSVYDGDDFSLLINRAYTPLLVDVTYRRRLFEILLDAVLVTFAYCAAYVIRFDRDTPVYYALIQQSLPIVIGCQLVAFLTMGIYRGTWRYIGLGDLTTFAKGIVLGVLGSVMTLVYLYRFAGYSRGVFVIDLMLLGLLVPGSRLSFRILGDAAGRRRRSGSSTLIYGAGDAGALLAAELRNNSTHALTPIGFVDDDRSKRGKRLLRLPVFGGMEDLAAAIGREGVEAIVISTTRLTPERLLAIEAICHASGTRLLRLKFGIEEMTLQRRTPE